MAHAPSNHSNSSNIPFLLNAMAGKAGLRDGTAWRRLALVAAVVLLSSLIYAQGMPQVNSVDPSSGKVNDTVTLTGDSLGKGTVSAVFLSNDKEDFKAAIVEQTENKIVLKVPQVKSGSYNISVLVGDKLLIKPIKFTVQE